MKNDVEVNNKQVQISVKAYTKTKVLLAPPNNAYQTLTTIH